MSELAVGSLKGLAANGFVIDVAAGSKVVQPGAILQVVSATTSTAVSTTSTTFQDSGLSATITPSSTTSKVLILAHSTGRGTDGNTANAATLFRGTTSGVNLAPSEMGKIYSNSSPTAIISMFSFNFLDSPGTTSSQQYTFAFRLSPGGSGTVSINDGGALSSITLMEVAG